MLMDCDCCFSIDTNSTSFFHENGNGVVSAALSVQEMLSYSAPFMLFYRLGELNSKFRPKIVALVCLGPSHLILAFVNCSLNNEILFFFL